MTKKYLLSIILSTSLSVAAHAQKPDSLQTDANAQRVLLMADSVKGMAETLIKSGFNAGDGYGEVWIRDFNTFMDVACAVNDKQLVREHLLTFFKFQQPEGAILDGYVPDKNESGVSYNYYHSALAPNYAGHKNTVETDQETSLIQAVYKYVKNTGDAAILQQKVGDFTVLRRMEMALEFLLNKRFDATHQLIWGATTADWGDVQPEHEWGVEINVNTHRAIDIYDNAMLIVAINNYIRFKGLPAAQIAKWKKQQAALKSNIRKYLWDKTRKQFKPHVYLDGSPFPNDFDESQVYYHGGTTVAIEAGLLSKKEVLAAYQHMCADVKAANAATIGLTLYPPYPAGSFKNAGMGPYSYQNGGDWTWFGGRTITQLINNDMLPQALAALQPMLARVLKNKGFYEWYTPANKPMGSSSFRGEAGVLWTAITALNAKLQRQKN